MKGTLLVPPEPRKRRDRLHIIAKILNAAKDGSVKTQIMYRANLNLAQLNEYLSFVLKTKLLKAKEEENGRTMYKITDKGVKFLQNLEEITSLLNKEDKNSVEINSPLDRARFWLEQTSS